MPSVAFVCFAIGAMLPTTCVLWIQKQRINGLHEQVGTCEQRVRLRDDQITVLTLQCAQPTVSPKAPPPSSNSDQRSSKPPGDSKPNQQNVPAPQTSLDAKRPTSLPRSNPCYAIWEMERNGKCPIAPCMFTLRAGKRNYVTAIDSNSNIVAPADASPKGAKSRPARPGDVVVLFGVGFGPRQLDSGGIRIATDEVSPFASTVRVKVGGFSAQVLWAGIIPVASPVGQLHFRLPDRLSEGDLTLQVEVAGISTQQDLLIPVKISQ